MFTADLPPELLPRCLAAPSVLAEVITDKFSKGLPLYRQVSWFGFSGHPARRLSS
jgi:transposase